MSGANSKDSGKKETSGDRLLRHVKRTEAAEVQARTAERVAHFQEVERVQAESGSERIEPDSEPGSGLVLDQDQEERTDGKEEVEFTRRHFRPQPELSTTDYSHAGIFAEFEQNRKRRQEEAGLDDATTFKAEDFAAIYSLRTIEGNESSDDDGLDSLGCISRKDLFEKLGRRVQVHATKQRHPADSTPPGSVSYRDNEERRGRGKIDRYSDRYQGALEPKQQSSSAPPAKRVAKKPYREVVGPASGLPPPGSGISTTVTEDGTTIERVLQETGYWTLTVAEETHIEWSRSTETGYQEWFIAQESDVDNQWHIRRYRATQR